eukprot:2664076-Rhodomonas_salina.2
MLLCAVRVCYEERLKHAADLHARRFLPKFTATRQKSTHILALKADRPGQSQRLKGWFRRCVPGSAGGFGAVDEGREGGGRSEGGGQCEGCEVP